MTNIKNLIPIFIGGCARSGTTLLGSMLGAHENMLVTPESHFKTEIYSALNHPNGQIKIAFDRIVSHHRFKHWDIAPPDRQSIVNNNQQGYPELILSFVDAYHKETSSKSNVRFWVDHTPSNIRHAKLLRTMFPNAKMIHIVRDGRAVAASIIPLDWGPNTVIAAARFWLQNISFGLAAEQFFGPESVLRVTFEALVSDPHKTLKSICRFIKIPFKQNMASGGGFIPPVYSAKQHQLVDQPPSESVVWKWQDQLTVSQIENFEALTADMLSYLRYDQRFKGKAIYPNVYARFKSDLYDISREYLINKLKHQLRRSKYK